MSAYSTHLKLYGQTTTLIAGLRVTIIIIVSTSQKAVLILACSYGNTDRANR